MSVASPTPSPAPEAAPPGRAEPMPDGFEPAAAPPTATCVQGWTRPARDDETVEVPLRLIRRQARLKGAFSLQDLRYFVGPEAPPSDKGYILEIERWYVKGHLAEDPAERGRWIVERRRFGAGVAAVAPYDTAGFASPDWTGFQYTPTVDPERVAGLPGRWQGVPYDFVKGGGGLDFPGLPLEVQGCLDQA